MADTEPPLPAHPDDDAILARWEQLGRPSIPIAFNERGLVWKTIADLEIYLSIPQDPAERQRAIAWVLAAKPASGSG